MYVYLYRLYIFKSALCTSYGGGLDNCTSSVWVSCSPRFMCVCAVEASVDVENRVLEVVLNPNFKSFDSEKQLSRVVFCSIQVPKEGEPSL